MKQQKLDKFIYESNNIDNERDLLHEKIIALDVEFSEFMNEIKSFKYWKKNKPIDKDKTLEEACDCLHFILSLSNDLKVDLTHLTVPTTKQLKGIDLNTLYRYIKTSIWVGLYLENDINSLKSILPLLVSMLGELGFTYNDLINAYDKKYEINIKRQQECY
ncbi:dUTP diphosphatase (plasmid) [Paraclostridium ghonii]|uniref:dUTP diphosphatase n=1 Tax=Paraclostridium ghonii TaxID=29358 RepID=UPI00202CFA74|nr:dUTP diphosphatase [Paeniclostridium ghonii]MCM0167619.1 dUTP diphosphatase [Paeniclostridium ghonii]